MNCGKTEKGGNDSNWKYRENILKKEEIYKGFEGGKRFLWQRIKIPIEGTAGTNVLGRESSQSIWGTTIMEKRVTCVSWFILFLVCMHFLT